MGTFRRIVHLVMQHVGLNRQPFILHEAYPEIVFWKVGQEVTLRGKEGIFDETTCAFVQDFDKNGNIIVKMKTYDSYSTVGMTPYTLQFVERISPSTILAKGVVRRANSGWRDDFVVSEIFNPHIRGKGGYMELLNSIREIIGMQDL